jgi:hypothetical protein
MRFCSSAVGIAGDAAQKKPKGWRSGEDWNLTPQTSKDNNTKAAALLHRLVLVCHIWSLRAT